VRKSKKSKKPLNIINFQIVKKSTRLHAFSITESEKNHNREYFRNRKLIAHAGESCNWQGRNSTIIGQILMTIKAVLSVTNLVS